MEYLRSRKNILIANEDEDLKIYVIRTGN